MIQTKLLSHLHIIAVRYRGSRLAERDERSLDAYTASGVYAAAGVPFDVVEPRFPEERREEDEAANIGLLDGFIAEEVARARRAGQAVLMTGGDCTHTTGVLGGLQDAHDPGARIGLVWLDAHGDFNTPKTTISGYLGGMPVAVAAGLAWPTWRERAHMAAPLPTDRIVMADLRNLDPPEEQLVRATAATVAAISPVPGFPRADFRQSVVDLAKRCDVLYLHLDSDILDARYVPNHRTREPGGPGMEEVQAAVETVLATGKVVALALVSVYGEGEGSRTTVASGIQLLRTGLEGWRRYGVPGLPPSHLSADG